MKKLPGEWTFQSLGEAFEVIGGGTPSKKVTANYDGDIPWATIRDMQTDEISGTERFITEHGLKNSSAKLIPTGEVVMASRVGLGRASILRQDTAINQDIRALIPKDPDQINRRFCLYWLQSMTEKIVAAGSGATVQGIKLPFIRSLPFPVVARDEQDFIVAILDQAFAALDRARVSIAASLLDGEQLFEVALDKLMCGGSSDGSTTTLGEVCSFENGDRGENYPGRKAFVPSGVAFINAGHLDKGRIDWEGMNYIPEDHFNRLSRGKIRKGDILFCLRGSLGKFGQVDIARPGAIASSLVIVRAGVDVIPDYLAIYFKSRTCSQMISKFAGGAAQPNLSARDLKRFQITLPKLEVQAAVVDRHDALLKATSSMADKYVMQSEALDELRQSLLQQAFSGQLTLDG